MKPRSARVEGSIAYIPLTKGYEAAVDVDDLSKIGCFNWYAAEEKRKDGSLEAVYARRNQRLPCGKRVTVLMHKEILPVAEGNNVDHVNGFGLDNRKINLREATRSQNMHNQGVRINNKTGFKGVSYDKVRGSYLAKITKNSIPYKLGFYGTVSEAAEAYRKASENLHGDFRRVC